MTYLSDVLIQIFLKYKGFCLSLLFCLSYVLSGELGLSLATLANQVSPIWPATGVAISILIIFGYQFWPAIALGAFTINYFTSYQVGSSIGIMVGNTLEALVGASLFLRTNKIKNSYTNESDFGFMGIIVAAFIAPIISAGFGGLSILGPNKLFTEIGFDMFSTWWTGDMLGALSVIPIFFTIQKKIQTQIKEFSFSRIILFIGFVILSYIYVLNIFKNPNISHLVFISYLLIFLSIHYFNDIFSKIFLSFFCCLFINFTLYYPPLFPGRTQNENLIHIQYLVATFIITHLILVEINKIKLKKIIFMVLLSGWILCSVLYSSLKQTQTENERISFQYKVNEIQNQINDRLSTYEDALAGGRSFVTANPNLNEKSWKIYVDTLNIVTKYPGINGVGVVNKVVNSEELNFIHKIKKDIPDFKIKGVPTNLELKEMSDKYVISYVYPYENNKQARGLDVGSESNRRIAAEISRDTGKAAITSPIVLVQDLKRRSGFLLFIPIYHKNKNLDSIEARRAQIVGWVYAPFISEDFFKEIIENSNFKNGKDKIKLSLFHSNNIDETHQVFSNIDSNSEIKSLYKFDMISHIYLGQSEFTIGWKKNSYFMDAYNESLLWVVVVGSLVCLLIALVVFSFENTRKKAQEIADKQTELFNQEKEKALTASKVKSEFLANMSHEIRTPLNGIVGMINLLMKSKLEADDHAKINIISQSCGTLLNLIDDVLNFSKLEANKLSLKREPCNIKKIVYEVVSLFNPKAQEKGLDIVVEFLEGDSSEWVLNDSLRLKQILSNLIGNALKFTDAGAIQLVIKSFMNQDEVNSRIYRIEVKDSGIGIKKELQDKLFLSFSQVDASSTKQFGGTGLGLSISKGLVELMGGKIWVESTYGLGSNFIFDFKSLLATPLAELESKQIEPPVLTSIEKNSKQENRPFSKLKILVVDDNFINLTVASMTLKKIGYGCDLAHSGHEAIQVYNEKSYDIIFMDCYMPEMDGFSVAREIRNICQNSERPYMVALTASIMQEDKDKSFESGMNDFLTKPVLIESFEDVIRHVRIQKGEIDANLAVNNSVLTNDIRLDSSMLIDFKKIESHFLGDEDVLVETIELFVNNYKKYLTNLESSIKLKNYKEIEHTAHAFKSSLSVFFSYQLRDLLNELEINGKNKIEADYELKLSEIKLLLPEFIKQITDLKLLKENILKQKTRKSA